MAGKKYLLLADLPSQRERVEAVAFSFMRAAYLTDSILFLLVDLKKDAFDTYRYLSRNTFFGSSKIQLLLKNQQTPEQIIQQMDYYIIGGHPDELFYVEAAVQSNVEIIGTRVAPEDIFSGVEVSAEVQQFKENLRALVTKDLLEKFPPEQYEYFLFHEGLGETMAVFFWLKEYRKPRDKKILVLCCQPLREEIMRVCPYVDAVMRIPQPAFDFLSIYYAEEYAMKKILTAHYSHKIAAIKNSMSVEELSQYYIHEIFRDFLEIPSSLEFKKYPVQLPEVAVARANELFKQINLTRGKTVFIVTEGIYFGGLEHHNEFWIKLARRLNVEGYDVVFNGQDNFFSDFKSVFLSLFETSAFVGLCGHIVSVPTGFVEACVTFNIVDSIKLQVVFPNNHDIYYKRAGVIRRLDTLAEIQRDGSGFASQNVEDYAEYIKKFDNTNAVYKFYQWSDTAAEDDSLIEKIVGEIISAI